MSFAILRVEKLKGSAVSSSDMHLDRKRETLNADQKRTGQNIYLIGGKGESLRGLVDQHIKAAGGKAAKGFRRVCRISNDGQPRVFFILRKRLISYGRVNSLWMLWRAGE